MQTVSCQNCFVFKLFLKMFKKRITVKHKCPNPLFEQWLTEWRDRAKEQDSKMQYCFSLALTTLKKYPLPLETGKDCKILKGFGEKLCNMLDEKLKKYKLENGDVIVNEPIPKATTPKKRSVNKTNKNSPKTNKEYIPLHGSGAYAILLALYEKSLEPIYPGFLTKNEIIKAGQGYCNVSFTKALPNCRYTGWSSMKILLEKKLVTKEGNPAKFSLTNEGSSLADRLYVLHKVEEFQKLEEKESDKPSCSNDNLQLEHQIPKANIEKNKQTVIETYSSTASSSSQASSAHETVILAPRSFEIILIVDSQELNGGKGDSEIDSIIYDLQRLNIRHEIKNLKVGDYTWIARDNFNNELILPYIIERKRMDDLAHSIKDDRFHEQKFRLKQSGISNLIYLIESFGRNEQLGLPISSLHQAATNTLVHDDFTVKFTENRRASSEYLACLTHFLENLFKEKTLISCPKDDLPPLILDDDLIHLMLFSEFNKASSKVRNFKVRDMFIRHLLQLQGMSVEKALAIVEKYPTPLLLKLSYNETKESEREKLLADIQYGPIGKKVGPVLSKKIYQLFCNDSYL